MLQRCISAEWLKLRHSHIGLIMTALPAISVLIGSANYYMNQGVLHNGWYSLWTQASLFYGEFFLPVLIAICCAYVCRLEHLNKNWNMIMTAPVRIAYLFLAKLIVVAALVFLVQLFFALLYYGAGKLFGLTGAFPAETFGWIARGWLASVTISAVQLWLSLVIRSFAVPIGISICAALIGLGMYVAKLGMLFPHSLLTIGMGAISQDRLTQADTILFLTMNTLFLAAVSLIAVRRLKKKDVSA